MFAASLRWLSLSLGCLFVVGCSSQSSPITNPTARYDTSVVPLPSFPELELQQGQGSRYAEVDLGVPAGEPGETDGLWILVPDRPPKELSRLTGEVHSDKYPCVFVGAAGATSLTGVAMSESEIAQYQPLVRDGFVVVGHGTDGELQEPGTDSQFIAAHRKFRASMAGLVNARNAIEFALAKCPDVDPERLYCFGHSSAAKLALLVATHDPRIKGCVSLAGYSDIEGACQAGEAQFYASTVSDWKEFATKASPRTHEKHLNAAVYLYHSTQDRVVSVGQSQVIAKRLRDADRPVRLVVSPIGDHASAGGYNNVQQASHWLRSLDQSQLTGQSPVTARLTDQGEAAYQAAKLKLDEKSARQEIRRYQLASPTYAAARTQSTGLALTHDTAGIVLYDLRRSLPEIEPNYVIPSSGLATALKAYDGGFDQQIEWLAKGDTDPQRWDANFGKPVRGDEMLPPSAMVPDAEVIENGDQVTANLDRIAVHLKGSTLEIATHFGKTLAAFDLLPEETALPEDVDADRYDNAPWHAFGEGRACFFADDRYAFVVFPKSVLMIDSHFLSLPSRAAYGFQVGERLYAGQKATLRNVAAPRSRVTAMYFESQPIEFEFDAKARELSFVVPAEALGTGRRFYATIEGNSAVEMLIENDVFPPVPRTPFHFAKIKTSEDPNRIVGLRVERDDLPSREPPREFTELAVYDIAAGQAVATLSPESVLVDAILHQDQLWTLSRTDDDSALVNRWVLKDGQLQAEAEARYDWNPVAIRRGSGAAVTVVCEAGPAYPPDDEKQLAKVAYTLNPVTLKESSEAVVYRRPATGLVAAERLAGGFVIDGVLTDSDAAPSRLLWDVPVPYSAETATHPAVHPFAFDKPTWRPATAHHLLMPYAHSMNRFDKLWRDHVIAPDALLFLQRSKEHVQLLADPFTHGVPVAVSPTEVIAPHNAPIGMPVRIGDSVVCSIGDQIASYEIPALDQANPPFVIRVQSAPLSFDFSEPLRLSYQCDGADEYRVSLRASQGSNVGREQSQTGTVEIEVQEHRQQILNSLLRAAQAYKNSFLETPPTEIFNRAAYGGSEDEKKEKVKAYAKMMQSTYQRITGEATRSIPHPIDVLVVATDDDSNAASSFHHYVFVLLDPQDVLDYITR